MKPKILILILFLIAQVAKGQFFEKNSNWSIITTNLFDDTFSEITTYKIDGDTTINDIDYYRVLNDDNYYCSLRETEDNKVYTYFSDYGREFLIYDFSWSPNDTLYHQVTYDPDSLYIQAILGNSIDSIQLLDGKYYKCIKNYFGDVRLIKGIGDTRGFFFYSFDLPLDGSQFSLLCFYIGETLIFSHPDYNYCHTSSINTIFDINLKINIYPNPGNTILNISSAPEIRINKIEIYNSIGQIYSTMKYNTNGDVQVPISELTKGIYIIKITDHSDSITSLKFVKQ